MLLVLLSTIHDVAVRRIKVAKTDGSKKPKDDLPSPKAKLYEKSNAETNSALSKDNDQDEITEYGKKIIPRRDFHLTTFRFMSSLH